MISIFSFLKEASTFCGDFKLGEGTSHSPDWLMFMRDNLKIFVHSLDTRNKLIVQRHPEKRSRSERNCHLYEKNHGMIRNISWNSLVRFKRRTLLVPNLIPIWVYPNDQVWQLIQTSNLMKSNLIWRVDMNLLQSAVITQQNGGKKLGKDKLWKWRTYFSCNCDEGGKKKATQDAVSIK